jgi:hypothetical protein
MSTFRWFSPVPARVTRSRISLDFGLRAADLFFRELVVPELGRVWFVRQLSWPLAALVLHEELRQRAGALWRPTSVAHGLEALACKLEYGAEDDDDRSERLLGRRAFGRDEDDVIWSFQRLCQVQHYVQNTHRQAATRTLQTDGGLGLARGPRFDRLELEPAGRGLADAFLDQRVGQGGMSLRKWLLGWLAGERAAGDAVDSVQRALSPDHPSAAECELVRRRLFDTDTPGSERRRHLAKAVGRASEAPDIDDVVVPRLREAGHRAQADDVVAARSFGAVLDRTRGAIAALTFAIESTRVGEKASALATESGVRRALADLRSASKRFLEKADVARVSERTGRQYAHAVIQGADVAVVMDLARRGGELFSVGDGVVRHGSLYRILDGADDEEVEEDAESLEPDRTGRTFRIKNLHALLRDVHGVAS